ncbi:MAG: M48 family metallopeptidase [Candidatus Hydrogenedentes bacterium]|nr:M48 family metallopeptidase [Candidatus Hydrogenedentota bacterium]
MSRPKSSLYPSQELRRRTLAWAVKLRVNPKLIRVQEMRRKWGSCSSAGTITLALDLTDQSERFQDYVIVHELLHLRYPTHGRLFKALMTAYVPGWRRLQPNDARTVHAVHKNDPRRKTVRG